MINNGVMYAAVTSVAWQFLSDGELYECSGVGCSYELVTMAVFIESTSDNTVRALGCLFCMP